MSEGTRRSSTSRRSTGAKSEPAASSAGSGLTQRLRRYSTRLVIVVASIAVLAALAVLPARTWLSQREQRNEVQVELVSTEAEVAQLQAQLTLLQTDAEIERRARENFDLVLPGEESFRILPPSDG